MLSCPPGARLLIGAHGMKPTFTLSGAASLS